jgi:hypothetical protein
MILRKRILIVSITIISFILLISASCSKGTDEELSSTPADITPSSSPTPTHLPIPSVTETISITATPTSLWNGLLLEQPVAFTTPLPEENWTPIDGTYAKLDPSDPQWWACRRCADYRPAGGIWKLQFNKGVMRIYYDVTGWRSIASYTIADDRLYLFNDPYCPEEVGEYTWRLEDKWGLENRSLILNVIKDSCSINLRGENLSAQSWESCQPPNLMTGASDHWNKTPGCETVLTLPSTPVPSYLTATVIVHPGYARKFAIQPDIYVDANKDEMSPPEGITLAHSDDSISYGLNRVLWGEGSFVEVTTSMSFNTMGVQIYGDHTIGWARVLFDGQEIWRGDTSEIWAYQGRNGGYIEVKDYESGSHTLRVESMGFDYHPVTVAFFGFRNEGSVQTNE